ncbi:hypothetical protein IC607_17045 [Cellulomonas sp. JH27-2]|uniref:hypothetical protein n=1 Tax=Cellulomonas sp. JH27-2 TaxID=2774139 RepID=UPI00177DCD00|nr:hypothetical protein [Cellulomonas sp. JH27-2]MBD8060678.1 hypothetical protein [Cellulomonas sp. JH27-2]
MTGGAGRRAAAGRGANPWPAAEDIPTTAWDVAEEAHTMLGYAGERVARGLSVQERERVERRFGFRFATVHRAFLAIGVPIGPMWPNWRARSLTAVAVAVAAPVDGVVADVLEHDFWPARWGPRPDDDAREAVARAELARVPVLVPFYGRQYLPAGARSPHAPVLGVYRTEVIELGDLRSVVDAATSSVDASRVRRRLPRVRFWSDVADVVPASAQGRGILAP